MKVPISCLSMQQGGSPPHGERGKARPPEMAAWPGLVLNKNIVFNILIFIGDAKGAAI